jgi:hypothetical protein
LGEADVIGRGQLLVAQHDRAVAEQGVGDSPKGRRLRMRRIDAVYLDAKIRPKGPHP